MYGLNYEGLKKRETYNEIIDYLMNKQEKIKMPNRLAKQLRESPQLSNLLDGDGEGVLDMEQQQRREGVEVERERLIRERANEDGGPAERRAFEPRPRPIQRPEMFNLDADDDLENDIDMASELARRQEEAKALRMNEKLIDHLAKQVNQYKWAPKAPGVWYRPGEATSSAAPAPPPPPPPKAVMASVGAPPPPPAKSVFAFGAPPVTDARARMKPPPKSLLGAVKKSPTPIKPRLHRMNFDDPPAPPKLFSVGKSNPLSPEEKADRLRTQREERTRKKNVQRMKETLKKEEKEKKKQARMEAEGESNFNETQKRGTGSRSVRRKN
jgi:hypothetical protein